jgi:hypothetical protein
MNPTLVGTSRCDVPARETAGGTNVVSRSSFSICCAAARSADGAAARHPCQVQRSKMRILLFTKHIPLNLELHSMNNRTRILVASLTLAAVCLLPGCSKSANTKSGSGTNAGPGTAFAPPDGPVTLKVNWAVGKEYAMRTEMTEVVEFKIPDEPKPVKQVRTVSMDYTVSVLKELADGGRELELQFTAVKTSLTDGNRQTLDVDSARDATPGASEPPGSILNRLFSERVRLVVNAAGKAIRVDGFKEFANRVIGDGDPHAKAVFHQMLNEDRLKEFGTVAEDLPDHAVKAGDHWLVNLELPIPIGIIDIHLKDTFKNWESHAGRQCVRIAFKGDFSTKPGSSANTSAKIENGDISGETWFDPALGMVVQSDDVEEMPLQFKNRGRIITGQVHRKASRTLLNVSDIGK